MAGKKRYVKTIKGAATSGSNAVPTLSSNIIHPIPCATSPPQIVTASWPDVAEIPEFPDDAATFRALIDKVEELRAVRAEWRIPPKEAMQVAIPATLAAETGLVQTLATIARAEFITYENGTAGSLGDRIAAVRAVADPVKLLERYERESTRLVAEYERSMRKLANRGFVNNAAPDVVAAERAKADGFRDELARIRRALDELG